MIGKISTVEIKYQIKEAMHPWYANIITNLKQSIIAYIINVTFEFQRARDMKFRI